MLYILPTGYPLGIGYPMGMGTGVNLCPWVLKWVGIESFYAYGFGKKDVVPAHTLPIAIPSRARAMLTDRAGLAHRTWDSVP